MQSSILQHISQLERAGPVIFISRRSETDLRAKKRQEQVLVCLLLSVSLKEAGSDSPVLYIFRSSLTRITPSRASSAQRVAGRERPQREQREAARALPCSR